MRIKYSIVIATADRPDCVAACLAKVREQVSEGIEAIIVDAGKAEPIDADALRRVWPELVVLRSAVRNAGIQRNVGVQHARGEIVIFLDDDCYVQPGWWPGIVEPLRGATRSEGGGLRSEGGRGRSEGGGVRSEGGGGEVETEDRRPTTDDPGEERRVVARGQEGYDTHSASDVAGHEVFERSTVYGLRLEGQEPRGVDWRNAVFKMTPVSDLTPPPSSLSLGAVAGGVWVNPHPDLTDERGGYINWMGVPVQITHRGVGAPREVDWLLTTNMAVLKSVYDEIGGIPHAYGIYDEDVDLGLKIRRAGYRIVLAADCAIYHYCFERPPKPVTSGSEFILGRNRSLLLVRHFGLLSRVWLSIPLQTLMRFGLGLRRGVRGAPREALHAASFCIGALWGVAYALRHPIANDRAEYEDLGDGTRGLNHRA